MNQQLSEWHQMASEVHPSTRDYMLILGEETDIIRETDPTTKANTPSEIIVFGWAYHSDKYIIPASSHLLPSPLTLMLHGTCGTP